MAIGAGAAGAWAATNATTHTVTLPAHAAGDLLVVIAACKAATITSVDPTITTPASGWTRFASFANGTTASGNGTGSVHQAIFYKVAASGSETNPVVTWGGGQTAAPGIAVGLGFTKASTEGWITPVAVQAATNAATSISVTMGSDPGITSGDWGVISHTTADDSALTVPTWSATSATLGTVAVYPVTPITSGTSNDMAGTSAYRSVTSGTATAAPVVTGTQAAAEGGVTCFIRLRVIEVPTGTTIYPTSTASAVSTASVDLEAWTSRGGGVATYVTSTQTNPGSPITLTDTAGGTVLAWFTKQLSAFTLSGSILVALRMSESNVAANAKARATIARVNSDGTSATSWATTVTTEPELTTSEAAYLFILTAADLAISDGQRLRLTIAIANPTGLQMAAGHTASLYVNGTASGATGDTYLTFTQTLTEFSAGTTVTPTTAALVITKNIPTVTVSNNQRVTPTTAALVATKYAPTIRLGQVVTVPTAGGAGYVAAVLADSPVGYWRMGEASGSVLDSIGSSHGTATGTTRDVAGVLVAGDDGAITFNGTSDKINFGDVLDITVGSYEVWFKRGATQSTTQYFFSKGGYQPNLHFNTTNNLVVGYEDNNWLYGTAAITDTNWHHVVFTHPGGASSGLAKLYIDGVDVTTTLTGADLAANSSNLRLGAAYVDALYFHGSLDEAAIYNTVLSPTRVLAHYTAGITAGGLVLTTFAPTIRQGVGVIPTTKALTLATFAPTVRTPILATPTTKAIVLTRYAPTVSTPVRATPAAVSLTATKYAPTIYLHQRVTPTTKALAATKYAPTVTTPERVTPTTKALALAAFAPVVTATSAQSVIPTTAVLLLGEQVPTVTATAHQRVTPTTASLVATKFAPTVTAGADVAVIPSNAAVTLTKYAPTVTSAQHVTVVPNAASLITSPQVPTAAASDHKRVTPTTAVLTITRNAPSVRTPILATPTTKALTATKYAPTVAVPQRVTPTTKALTLASFAPTITNPQRYVPTTAALAATKYAPTVDVTAASTIVVPNKSLTITRHIATVSATAHLAVTPPAAALTGTKYAPTVTTTAHQVVVPGVKSLIATKYAPTVTASSSQGIVPGTKALTLTRFAPTVSTTAHIAVIPATKVLQLTRYAPVARVANLVTPPIKALVLTTLAPIVTPTLNTLVRPAPFVLTVTRFAPHLEISGHAAFEPITAALLLTTYAPTAEMHSLTPLPDLIYGFAIVAMGDSAGVGVENGGATVRSEGGGTAVLTSGPSARVTIR